MSTSRIERSIDECIEAVFSGDFASASKPFNYLEDNGAKGQFFDALRKMIAETSDAKILGILALDSVEPGWAVFIAGVLSDNKRYDTALAILKEVAETSPTHDGVFEDIALCYARKHLLDEALAAALEAVRWYPDSVSSFCTLGLIHRCRKEMELAVAAYKRSIELDASDPDGYSSLAMCLIEMQAWDEARAACCSAIALESKPDHWMELAEIEFRSGNNAQALRAIDMIPANCQISDRARDLRHKIETQT